MIKRKKIWVITFLLASAGAGFYLLKNLGAQEIPRMLTLAGLTPLSMKTESPAPGVTLAQDIVLDKDEISTIKALKLSRGISGTSVTVEGMQMIGDALSDFSISGIHLENFPYNLSTLPINLLEIKKSGVAILTPQIGGINVSFDAQMDRNEDAFSYQVRLKSAQKNLSLQGQFSGTIRASEWTLEGDIEEAKFDLPFLFLKATRAQGKINITGTPYQDSILIAQLSAGGAEIFGLPFENLTLTLEKQGLKNSIEGNGKALEEENIEVTLSGTNAITYSLFAPNYETLHRFLKQHGRLDFLSGTKLESKAKDITLTIKPFKGNQLGISAKTPSSKKVSTFYMKQP